MAFDLHVDTAAWQAHVADVLATAGDVVPVVKGNGYGFGRDVLVRTAEDAGCSLIAVGTYPEAAELLPQTTADLLILTAWRPAESALVYDARVVHTVSRLEDLEALREAGGGRWIAEVRTSMRRHGLSVADAAVVAQNGAEGVAIHLPIARAANLTEAEAIVSELRELGLPDGTVVYVSHLSDAQVTSLRQKYPQLTFRPRLGTRLWLGAPKAMRVRAQVLDVHPVARGDRIGYRQNTVRKAGHVLVVAGGTSHGVGLEAPRALTSWRARLKSMARGLLDGLGRVRSPFRYAGQRLLFAEPPHMQASMLLLPGSGRPPAVGEAIDVAVRYTTADFDQTLWN